VPIDWTQNIAYQDIYVDDEPCCDVCQRTEAEGATGLSPWLTDPTGFEDDADALICNGCRASDPANDPEQNGGAS